MKIAYTEKRFNATHQDIIEKANEIIENYQDQGLNLTLRQLYYRFVAKDLFPDDMRWRLIESTGKWVRDPKGTKNAPPNYKFLGGIISDARMAGHVDWDAIIDRTRELVGLSHWKSADELVAACARGYHVNRWEGQGTVPEVWIEKDALIGVFEGICQQLDVGFFSCRGYTSQSGMWEAGRRILKRFRDDGQKTRILHFGDHDPSGVDMTRDIQERIEMFTEGEGSFTLHRIALHFGQVEELDLPPNPTKITDSRAKEYIKKFGMESWELDALEPKHLAELVEVNVLDTIDDHKMWERRKKEQAQGRQLIKKAADWMVAK